jgi:hypothetical protein
VSSVTIDRRPSEGVSHDDPRSLRLQWSHVGTQSEIRKWNRRDNRSILKVPRLAIQSMTKKRNEDRGMRSDEVH